MPRRLSPALRGALLVAACSTPALAQQDEKLSIHGYLTQGYAASDSTMQIGIPEEGTTDYRRAALLFRYAGTPKDHFVIQLANRRLGESPTMTYEDDVKVDWAFYERRVGGGGALRVGKVPIPFGIYNEVRYVGTVLPFYRAPYSVYFEGNYTSEAVDGISYSHSVNPTGSWGLDVAGYGGNYRYLTASSTRTSTGTPIYVVAPARAKNELGTQAWLRTPLTGLRLGGGWARNTSSGGVLFRKGPKETRTGWHAGLDGSFDRFALRGEYRTIDFPSVSYAGGYVQAGARLVGALSLNAQYEHGDVDIHDYTTPAGPMEIPLDYQRDYVVGLNYAFSSSLVLKVEGHQTKGFNVESPVSYLGDPTKGRYVITSLSASF